MDDAHQLMARALKAMQSALRDLDQAECSPEIGAYLSTAIERLQLVLDDRLLTAESETSSSIN
jgi:hypothetical protein